MIQCPFCPSQFSTNGSYRVHKHRYHRAAVIKRRYPTSDNTVIEHPVNSSVELLSSIPQLNSQLNSSVELPVKPVIEQRYPTSDNTASNASNRTDNISRFLAEYAKPPANTRPITSDAALLAKPSEPQHQGRVAERTRSSNGAALAVGLGVVAAVVVIIALFGRRR